MFFYPYLADVSDDDSIAYSFTTKTGTIYRVYFYPAKDYSDYVQAYPYLHQHGYIFGFTKTEPNENKTEALDAGIKATIIQIISEFFNQCGSDSILLYHCDNYDGKQQKRNNCFLRWYKQQLVSARMENTVITAYDETGHPVINNYVGFIIRRGHPLAGEIAEEFQGVKDDLVKEKD